MARLWLVSLALVTALVFAGCAATTSGPGAKSTSSSIYIIPSASAAAPGADTGSIAGRVVDDEHYPVYGATVIIRELNRTADTDASGAVTFNEVPPGVYSIFGGRLGFNGAAARATVTAGEVTNVTLILKPVSLKPDPFLESKRRSAFIQFGYSWLSVATYLVNSTGLHEALCQGCVFTLQYTAHPQGAMSEATWQCSPCQPPVVNEDIWYLAYKNQTTTAVTLLNTYLSNREHYNWTEAQVPPLWSAKDNAFTFRLEGGGGATAGAGAFNYNQRIEFWHTMSYHEDMPENFSALPPP